MTDAQFVAEVEPMSRSCRYLLVSLIVIASMQQGHAANTEGVHPYLSDKYFVDVGVFWPDRRLRMSVNGSAGEINEPIEFEENLKLKKADDIFSAEFGWRFTEKWRLIGQHFESGGDTSWVLDEDIEWQDVIFQAGTRASGGAEFTLLRVFFARDFNVGKRHEFGLGAGIHWLDISAYIEGTILIESGESAYAKESVGISAPLPNIGTWYNYSLSDRWALTSRLDFFSADIGRYDGTMANFSIGFNYQVARNFGLGLNYNYFDLDVGINKSNWTGRVETSYEGIYANLSFFW
jgi:hypothetical protein